ncbi:STAS-like domain-containing protein [Brucella sp. 6810]|uniref:STAS-like domain-containing protein n=1 Tax=Brucella sp. 6810 TaxID=2769351 RepID=UPI00165AFAC8|nr:STAS-like domain-containing protein [Brucella sp. 6810]QNQ62420.1 STAS-like domain-containing protein [Brucella sp. 6810]
MMRTISIVEDFTPFPGGRFKRNGKGSGEEFRERYLIPLLKNDQKAEIRLDGASGYPPSFLEEAFGGLVRAGYEKSKIEQLLTFKASPEYESYVTMIWQYIDKEVARMRHA